jgi:hypothetical protein
MKKTINTIIAGVMLIIVASCEPQTDQIGEIGPQPTNGKITVDDTDPYNPVFTASADKGFIYNWDMGNNQLIAPGQQQVTSYYPFAGTYNVVCIIYGAGAASITATTTFSVAQTDPSVASKPIWKELTGEGKGKTWVYNTTITDSSYYPAYCYQTYNDSTYDYGGGSRCWEPANSWGQCVAITPDVFGEMVFDLVGGINYTYHHVAGDAGVKGTFILDADKKTLTITNPHILDYNIQCTEPAATATGVYSIVRLTDDEMILWQKQTDIDWGTGWGWSFKRKQ